MLPLHYRVGQAPNTIYEESGPKSRQSHHKHRKMYQTLYVSEEIPLHKILDATGNEIKEANLGR